MKKLVVLSVVMLVASFASAEMLTNGDFSDSTLVSQNDGALVGDFSTGAWITDLSWAQGFDIVGGVLDVDSNYQKAALQYVDIVAGDITVSFDINMTNAANFGAYWYIGVLDDADARPTAAPLVSGANRLYEGSLNAYNGLGVTTVSQTVTIPQDAIDLGGMDKILVGFTSSAAGLYTIDNVSMTPEPATMSLLGLGGLALLRRRRR